MPPKLTSGVFGLPAGSVLLHLLDWVRLHKADVDEKAKEVLQSESPAEHCDYWDVVSSSARTYIPHEFRLQLWNHLSCASVLASAGCELHPAGQVGRGQTDADEAGGSTSRSEEHVPADGQSAQQDAVLQCMIFSFYLSIFAADNICFWNWICWLVQKVLPLFWMKKPKYESFEIVYRPVIVSV